MTPIDAAKEWIARRGKPDSAAFAELYADDGASTSHRLGLGITVRLSPSTRERLRS
jgi:hypothetical protein